VVVAAGATGNLERALARGYTLPPGQSLDQIYAEIGEIPRGFHTDYTLSKTMLEPP